MGLFDAVFSTALQKKKGSLGILQHVDQQIALPTTINLVSAISSHHPLSTAGLQ